MFADRATIIIRSGKGGNGCASFRREKYVPDGGPDGGDGGDGGSVIFETDNGMNTLANYRHRRKYSAGNGEDGSKRNRHGSNGDDLILKVPEGTIIRDLQSGKIIADMSGDNTHIILLKGGRGGLGNQHFATSRMQAPQYAQPGKEAQELEILLELKVIADVGLVGFPNVGKSTLLSRVTNAQPKIANYHFTTLQPNLGVVDLEDGTGFVIADIPGLIEGASEGIGLGHEFLRHIERTKVIVHMVDAAGTEGRDPIADINAINKELEAYNPELLLKPQVIAANKIDLIYDEEDENITLLKEEFEKDGMEVYPISAATGQGIRELMFHIRQLLEQCPKETIVYEPEYNPSDAFDQDGQITVTMAKGGVYIVSGPKLDKMLGYTNLESEKGFAFFQRFLREQGIVDLLEQRGIQEGDTVRIDDLEFEYYK
ncbi:MAG: GTPase ObgE [Clostridiales bacterium]|nr:GTPase ObgE [Clostridiales bacterium]